MNNTLLSNSCKLSQLFYYDIAEMRNADLRKGLREYKLLVSALEHAIEHFENKELDRFDSLVGENACQIRAVKIAILASENEIDFSDLKIHLKIVKEKLNNLLHKDRIHSLMSSDLTLKDVIESETLDLFFCREVMFLFQSFLLTEMKQPQPKNSSSVLIKDKAVPKNLKKFDPDVSSNFMDCVASKLRRLLSNASVNFVRELAETSADTHLTKMVSEEFTHEHNTWPCTPMFWTYKVLLQEALDRSIPIVLNAKFLKKSEDGYSVTDQEILYFRPILDENGRQYVLSSPEEIDLTVPACIVQGVVCSDQEHCKKSWMENISNHSILDIILSGAADHRQYPDPNIEILITDPEFERYKSSALLNGFSLENPSTFFINHVYAQTAEKASYFSVHR